MYIALKFSIFLIAGVDISRVLEVCNDGVCYRCMLFQKDRNVLRDFFNIKKYWNFFILVQYITDLFVMLSLRDMKPQYWIDSFLSSCQRIVKARNIPSPSPFEVSYSAYNCRESHCGGQLSCVGTWSCHWLVMFNKPTVLKTWKKEASATLSQVWTKSQGQGAHDNVDFLA
jgi:hypothetical protein